MFALIITSCNKYADDFAALKDQIAALAVQVNGVVQLQADLTAAKAQITAIQGVVATLPTATTVTGQFTALTTALAAVATKIDAITTTLGAVATAGTATKAVVDKLAVDLAKMVTDKIAADKVLNDKLDALKVQLALTATSAEVKAIQAEILKQIAASALSTDANVNAKIAAATEAINKVITDGLSATNENLNSKIAAAKLALEQAISASITSINEATAAGLLVTDGKIEAAKAALEALINGGILAVNGNTDAKVTALEAALKAIIDAGNVATLAKIDATLLALQGNPTNADKTKLTIQGLQLALAAAQADITTILNSTAMYNGNVIINSDAAVDFFFGKLNQLAIVNGSFEVVTELITSAFRAKLNTIMSKVQAVINGSVYIESSPGDNLSLPLLSQVYGFYYIHGADVNDPKIASVGWLYILDYDGVYESTSLKYVGWDVILDYWGDDFTEGTDDDWMVTGVNFPNVEIKNGGIWSSFEGWGSDIDENVLTLPNAKFVLLGSIVPVEELYADSALTVTLKNVDYPNGLIVDAPMATIVDLTGCETSDDDIHITTVEDGVVSLPNLVDCEYNVTIEGPTIVSIPLWDGVGGEFVSTTATTVNLAKYDWSTPATIPAVEHLTLGAVNNMVDMNIPGAFEELLTAEITGAAKTDFSAVSYNVTNAGVFINGVSAAGLTTLKLHGVLRCALVIGCGELTSLTTSGVINNLIVANCTNPGLKTLALGHTHFPQGPGTSLIIHGNTELTSLTTSTNYPRVIMITGNAKLATLNLASNTTANLALPVAATAVGTLTYADGYGTPNQNDVFWVYGNNLSGTYTAAVPTSGAGTFTDAKIYSSALLPIKALVTKIVATTATYGTGYVAGTWGFNINLQVEDVDVAVGVQSLTEKMQADKANAWYNTAPSTGVIDDVFGTPGTYGINLSKEVSLLN